jgi:PAS domain S-box-containing protein
VLTTKLSSAVFGVLPIVSGCRTIRFWLRWLVVACVFPAALVAAFLLVRSYQHERAVLEATTVATARALGQAVERELGSALAAMQVLATSPPLVSGDIAAFHARAREVLRIQAGNGIVLTDTTGQQVMSTIVPYGEKLPRSGVPDLLRVVFDTAGPAISDFYVGATSKRPQVAVGVPVLRDGKVIYGLTMGILPERLGDILRKQNLPPDWVVSIFDSTGTIVARTHAADQFVGKKGSPALMRRLEETSEGVLEAPTLEGIPVLAGFSRSGTTGWAVGIGVPTAILTADLRHSLMLNAAAAVLVLALGVWLAGTISRRITWSIGALATSASGFGSSGTLSLSPAKITEVDELRQVLVAASRQRDEAERSLQETIKQRDQAQSMIAEREERLRSIIETAPDAVITIDERGTVQSFSVAAERLFGYAAGEVIGQNIKMLMPAPHRENHDFYLSRYLRTGEKRIIGLGRQVEALRKDGSIFPMHLAVGEVKLGEDRIFSGFVTDLTSRVKIEEELRQAQKMEAIGQLTGGVAHDFNNLLTVIFGNLEMLERRLKDPRHREMLEDARAASRLGAELAKRLLAFGRRQALDPRPLDLNALVEGMVGMLRRSLGGMVEIDTRLAAGPLMVVTDSGQVENALLNLALNARDAMPKGGRLVIETARAKINEAYAAADAEIAPGKYIKLSVMDTGTGMAPEARQRAFEPFYTTKGPGVGSGLGLSMVYGFVKQSGGHVEIHSELGRGTTVCLYLPALEGDAGVTERRAGAAGPRAASGETILFVEDHEPVRRVTVKRLKELGYAVIEAGSGAAALRRSIVNRRSTCWLPTS